MEVFFFPFFSEQHIYQCLNYWAYVYGDRSDKQPLRETPSLVTSQLSLRKTLSRSFAV